MIVKANFQWPLDKNIIRRKCLSNLFGMVRINSDGSPRAHQGWDFYAPEGTTCKAVASGVVNYVGFDKDYGNYIQIWHSRSNLYSFYAHMTSIFYKVGDGVLKGQAIGTSGTTGNAQGMTGEDQHLHFEFRSQNICGRGLTGRVDPIEIFETCPLNSPAYLHL